MILLKMEISVAVDQSRNGTRIARNLSSIKWIKHCPIVVAVNLA